MRKVVPVNQSSEIEKGIKEVLNEWQDILSRYKKDQDEGLTMPPAVKHEVRNVLVKSYQMAEWENNWL
jgi:hypothetical protein